jgi:protein-tyrosine phosphatase
MMPDLRLSSSSRHVPLKGGCNFRDIGGYPAGDGRTVRWGRVYRTGTLCYLTDSDREQLDGLGIRGIFDLRRSGERLREPTCWPNAAVSSYTWDDGDEAPSVARFFQHLDNSAAGMRTAMLELYRALPTWMAPRIRDFLRVLCEDDAPVVIHCSAGKDRTGLAVAMLLMALGVRREDVLYDYLLTNELGNLEQFMLARPTVRLGLTDAQHPFLAMPADQRRALLIADEAYLDASFRQIEREYGGVESYIQQALGLSEQARNELQTKLLEGKPA